MGYRGTCVVDNRYDMGIFLDNALRRVLEIMYVESKTAKPVCNSRSSRVAVLKLSMLPSSSKPIILFLKSEREIIHC
jgi:hypothetical protein